MNASETRHRVTALNRNCNLTGTCLTFLLLAGLYVFALKPVLADSLRVAKLEEATQTFLESTDQITREAQELQSQSAGLDAQMSRILAGVPESPEESEFLGQLAGLAHKSSLKLDEFRPGRASPAGKYRQLEIELTGKGSYGAICRFLAGLEELQRLCRVRNLDVSSSEDPESESYPVRMTLIIFFAPPGLLEDQDARDGGNER